MPVHAEVSDALAAGRPVVALESTIVSHGLPRPDNLRLAREFEAEVRSAGAVPATVAVVDGEPAIGLDDDALEAGGTRDDGAESGVRGLSLVFGPGGGGAADGGGTGPPGPPGGGRAVGAPWGGG